MEAAWPGLVVEEANLAVQISSIRRALARVPGGDGWIETLARRGYRFVGPVVALAGRESAAAKGADRRRTNLPQVLTSFVGREREIAEIKQLLPSTRLLTLTGTGGIGKTRLALQAAAEVLDAYRDGIWFVDLAPLLDPALVPSALAQVLGVKEAVGQPLLATLCKHLRGKELLLVLDNCEHVIGASADLVDTLLRETARVSVVATSRESLRVASERTFPLGALPLPDPKASAAAIARCDAVRLFVDRARQHRPRFDLEVAAVAGGGADLRAARWAASGTGAGSGARSGAAGGRDRAPARPAFSVADEPRRAAATADAARDDRLELRAARSGGAAIVCATVGVRRRVDLSGRGSDR